MNIKQNEKQILVVASILVIAAIILFATILHINQKTEITTEDTTAVVTTNIITTTTTTTTEVVTAPKTSSTTRINANTTTVTTTEKPTKSTTKKTTTKPKETTTEDKSSEKLYSASYFRQMGELYWNGYRWTWYSEKALPGKGLKINGRHTDDDKYVCDENNYICCASSTLKYGTVIDTPFGKQGKIYDSGCASDTIDVYVSW